MRFATPLVPARLIRRYMRFLSDVELEDGTVVKAHCPNPGSMMGLKDVGLRVWLEPNEDPKKKLDWGWRLVAQPDAFVGIDTGAANRIVADATERSSNRFVGKHLVPTKGGFHVEPGEVGVVRAVLRGCRARDDDRLDSELMNRRVDRDIHRRK